MNEYENEGSTLKDIAIVLAIILVVIMLLDNLLEIFRLMKTRT